MNISRRTLMIGSGALALISSGGQSLFAQDRGFSVDLPIPKLEDLTDGRDAFDLIIQEGKSRIVPSGETRTYGYSGSLLGPVVRVRTGQTVTARIVNRLQMSSSVHWHGLLVPSNVDGPFNPIAPGQAWSPTLHVRQPAATAWFHPHPHGDTARQTYMGLAGLLYVEDGSAAEFDLPRDYGSDDLPIILQDRRFGPDGQLIYDRSPMAMIHGMRGDVLLVNGAVKPVSRPPAGLVRLRLLNGANARNFKLAFSDGRAFHVIANDVGWLAEPVPLTEIELSPGERYEVLVDFSDGRSAELLTSADHVGMGSAVGGQAGSLPAPTREQREALMRFTPFPAPDRTKRVIPLRLHSPGSTEQGQAVRRRSFTLDSMLPAGMPAMGGGAAAPAMNHGGHAGVSMPNGRTMPMSMPMRMGINGSTYGKTRIDVEAIVGSTEIWTVRSAEMAHPFHIHGATFRTLSKDGKPPPAEEAGVKDTVLVRRDAELLVSFKQPSTRQQPFVFHCHILEHEELGMMSTLLAAPAV